MTEELIKLWQEFKLEGISDPSLVNFFKWLEKIYWLDKMKKDKDD